LTGVDLFVLGFIYSYHLFTSQFVPGLTDIHNIKKSKYALSLDGRGPG
jgi:hypothetical protein